MTRTSRTSSPKGGLKFLGNIFLTCAGAVLEKYVPRQYALGTFICNDSHSAVASESLVKQRRTCGHRKEVWTEHRESKRLVSQDTVGARYCTAALPHRMLRLSPFPWLWAFQLENEKSFLEKEGPWQHKG